MDFKAAYAGRNSLRVGSAHLNNEQAKKYDVASNLLRTLLDNAEKLQVDIIGIDINQGNVVKAVHGMSPLGNAFLMLKKMQTASQSDEPEQVVGPGADDDCVGFLIPRGSKLWKDCDMKARYFCLSGSDIGLRLKDEGSHRPVVANFRIKGAKNKRTRNPATALARRQRSTRARKKRRREPMDEGAGSGAPGPDEGDQKMSDSVKDHDDQQLSDSESESPWAWTKGATIR